MSARRSLNLHRTGKPDVADDALTPADRADAPTASGRLDSWKEIAAYLKRDVTTVRRWEKREGLPVHRHLHERRESVYAYSAEIDRWWHGRRNHLSGNGAVHRASRVSLLWTAAATIVAALLVLTVISRALSRRMTSHDETEVRFSLSPPDESSFRTVSLSPDGRRIAFTASGPDGRSIIWIRPLDSVDVRPLSGTEGATFPFWAPDGRRLGLFAGQKLRTVNLAGGSAHMLADAPRGRGGTWSQQDVIVFAPDREGPLFKVQASGGAATPVTTIDRPGERGHVWPQFLPDGNNFLYLADSAISEHHNLFSGALDNTKRIELMHLVSNAEYVPSGYLLFARDRQLVAQPFDARRLQLHGDP